MPPPEALRFLLKALLLAILGICPVGMFKDSPACADEVGTALLQSYSFRYSNQWSDVRLQDL